MGHLHVTVAVVLRANSRLTSGSLAEGDIERQNTAALALGKLLLRAQIECVIAVGGQDVLGDDARTERLANREAVGRGGAPNPSTPIAHRKVEHPLLHVYQSTVA